MKNPFSNNINKYKINTVIAVGAVNLGKKQKNGESKGKTLHLAVYAFVKIKMKDGEKIRKKK